MCDRKIIEEVVSAKIEPLKIEIAHIRETLDDIKEGVHELPCRMINEEQIKLVAEVRGVIKDTDNQGKDIQNLYSRVREVEQDKTNKIWAVLIAVCGSLLSGAMAIAVYKLTRG